MTRLQNQSWIDFPVLPQQKGGNVYGDIDGLWICGNGVQEVWDIPREATAIQFMQVAKPTKNSVKIELTGTESVLSWIFVDEEIFRIPLATYRHLVFLIGSEKPAYLECYYWEP